MRPPVAIPAGRGLRTAFARVLCLALLAATLAGDPARAAGRGRFQGSGHPAVPLGALTLRVLRLPVGWVVGWVDGRRDGGESSESASLRRADGWTPLGFPLRDSGLGLLVQLRGRAEIGTVEIVFEDGELQRLDGARSRIYGGGFYELAAFERERRVMAVRLTARAHSKQAGMRVLLLREAPAGT